MFQTHSCINQTVTVRIREGAPKAPSPSINQKLPIVSQF